MTLLFTAAVGSNVVECAQHNSDYNGNYTSKHQDETDPLWRWHLHPVVTLEIENGFYLVVHHERSSIEGVEHPLLVKAVKRHCIPNEAIFKFSLMEDEIVAIKSVYFDKYLTWLVVIPSF